MNEWHNHVVYLRDFEPSLSVAIVGPNLLQTYIACCLRLGQWVFEFGPDKRKQMVPNLTVQGSRGDRVRGPLDSSETSFGLHTERKPGFARMRGVEVEEDDHIPC